MKLCHGIAHLKERKGRRTRLFTCKHKDASGIVCNEKWAWTETRGYYQQGRPRVPNPKSVIKPKRFTVEEARAIEEGRAVIELRWLEESELK